MKICNTCGGTVLGYMCAAGGNHVSTDIEVIRTNAQLSEAELVVKHLEKRVKALEAQLKSLEEGKNAGS